MNLPSRHCHYNNFMIPESILSIRLLLTLQPTFEECIPDLDFCGGRGVGQEIVAVDVDAVHVELSAHGLDHGGLAAPRRACQ